MSQSGLTYNYLYDGKGNVSALIDNSQNVVASYRYDTFGRLMGQSGTITQPFQFSTKRYFPNLGLNDYGYRLYSPALGRWTTRDPIGERGGVNLYGFVLNDPVNFVDPLGFFRYSSGAGAPVNSTLEDSMECFEECVGNEVEITGAKETRDNPSDKHNSGNACDASVRANPWLGETVTEDQSKTCYQRCFNEEETLGLWEMYGGQPHMHIQDVPGGRGWTGWSHWPRNR